MLLVVPDKKADTLVEDLIQKTQRHVIKGQRSTIFIRNIQVHRLGLDEDFESGIQEFFSVKDEDKALTP